LRLKDKTAIVTGAARGIGEAIALRFAQEGANVVIVDVDIEEVEKVAREIERKSSQGVLAFKADVSSSADVGQMVKSTLSKFEKIDILVNNAGISMVRPSEELTEEDWDKVMSVNLKGVFICCQAVGREMIKNRRGNIINIASMDGVVALPERAAYCASKAGVIMLTKVLAIEWAKYNIRVNAISPGYTKTKIVADLIAKGVIDEKSINRRCPIGRMARTDEIANIAVFLSSEESSYITGENILVDGGWTAYGYL
jgi:NAD(P)-dependent dehydrogenase (short-subunit alcohol dehydrogenase family)